MKKARKVVATAITCDRIDLSWKPVPGAQKYRVYRTKEGRSVKVSDRNLVAVTRATHHEDRELQPAMRYRYAVVAVGADMEQKRLPDISCRTLREGLFLTRQGSALIVHGDTFEVTWNCKLGGEITQISQYDGAGWFRVNAMKPLTVPGFTFIDKRGKEHAAAETRAHAFKVEKNTPEEMVLSTSVMLNEISVGFRYFVFKEGMLFCELSIPHKEVLNDRTQGVDSEANKRLLDKVSVRMSLQLNPEILRGKFMWGYYQREYPGAHVWKKPSENVTDPKHLLPIGMADYGRNKDLSFTNHLEIFIEDTPPDGASSLFGNDGQGGFKLEWSFRGKAMRNLCFLPWDMGFLRMWWGMCLGATRKSCFGNVTAPRQNNLIGARILHAGGSQGATGKMRKIWPFNVPPVNLLKRPYDGLPSDRAITRAKKSGASVIIMHQSWMRSGGSNCDPPSDYIPRDPVELKRFVQTCHRHGIRVGLYMRGTERHALFQPYFEKFLKRNFDGLYVDWSSPYAFGYLGCMELHFSAFSYFLFIKALRQRVGDKGFLIAHSGMAPTMIAYSVFDAYLSGEFATQKNNFLNSPDEAVYHGFLSCVGANPICSWNARGVAFNAGLGLVPHAPFGSLKEGPARHFMDGLWRIWRSVPIEKAHIYNSLTENFRAVETSNKDFHIVVYKVNRNIVLLVTANLGEDGSTALRVNMPGLGLTGTYRIRELSGDTVEEFKTRDWGVTQDGIIHTGIFKQYEYRGYRLNRIRGPRNPGSI